MDFYIPTEVKDKSAFPQIKKLDRQIICAAVLMGLSNQEAFRLFHPEYADARGGLNDAGKLENRHFWSYGKVKDYRQIYEEELAEYLGLCKRVGSKADLTEELSEERKDSALKSLLNKALALVEKGGELDPDTLKTIADLFKRLGVLKDEVEQQVRPLRFLPEKCFSGCRYRLFVENAVKGGSVIDECKFCRALRYATENGYRDDASNRLDIPKEILDKELENTVKTADILSGKIEN